LHKNGLAGFFGCTGRNIMHQDLGAGLGAHLCNALSHGARAHHSHTMEVCIHIRTIMADIGCAPVLSDYCKMLDL
jgi:hypothetical protein